MKITHELLNSLNELNKGNEVYKTFNSLFIDAVKYGAITRPANETETEKQKIFHEGMFKIFCIIKFGDDSVKHFDQLLTKELFLQYLKYDKKRTDRIMKSWKVETDNFDSDDKTNPLIFDMELITGLHNNFRSFIFETPDIDTFKNYFRKRPMKIEKREGITISELCYFFGKIESKQTAVKNFGEWMKNHIEGNNYGKNKAEFERIIKDINVKEKFDFSKTTPQQKALENKQKIDDLFNRMYPD